MNKEKWEWNLIGILIWIIYAIPVIIYQIYLGKYLIAFYCFLVGLCCFWIIRPKGHPHSTCPTMVIYVMNYQKETRILPWLFFESETISIPEWIFNDGVNE
jgi:hypothetical protein